MRNTSGLFFVLLLGGLASLAPAAASDVSANGVLRAIAQAHLPDEKGAMGRNRRDYIHARFQYRAHLQAQLAVVAEEAENLDRFVRALGYAAERQNPNGSYSLEIPRYLAGHRATRGDLASGTAFFLATAGAGALLLRGSSWFSEEPALAPYRQHLNDLQPGLHQATRWLAGEVDTLHAYDRHAPNRLLINALAFLSMANLSGESRWRSIGERFLDAALEQQHQLGYFVEGGGYDSSYNGVALAVGLRLVQLGLTEGRELEQTLMRSAQWQLSRVSTGGEIETEGNARVHGEGESFMGKPKQVDVAHTVEAFLLASQLFDDAAYLDAAEKICRYYLCD